MIELSSGAARALGTVADDLVLAVGPASDMIAARAYNQLANALVQVCDCRDVRDARGLRSALKALDASASLPSVTVVFTNAASLMHDVDALGVLLRFSRTRDVADEKPFTLRLLQGDVLVGDRSIGMTPREIELLGALAVSEGAVESARLTAILWPDYPSDNALRTLKVYASRVRKRCGDRRAIEPVRGGYRLGPIFRTGLLELESNVFAIDCTKTLSQPERRYLELVVASLREFAAKPLAQTRAFAALGARLLRIERRAATALGQDDLHNGRYDAAIERAKELTKVDPCDEQARRIAIFGFLAAGDKAGASHEYRTFEQALGGLGGTMPPDDLRAAVEMYG